MGFIVALQIKFSIFKKKIDSINFLKKKNNRN